MYRVTVVPCPPQMPEIGDWPAKMAEPLRPCAVWIGGTVPANTGYFAAGKRCPDVTGEGRCASVTGHGSAMVRGGGTKFMGVYIHWCQLLGAVCAYDGTRRKRLSQHTNYSLLLDHQ